MTSLRTRLFVVLGAVLAASIAAAGLLSRRATLVEVRKFVPRVENHERFEAAVSDIQQQVFGGSPNVIDLKAAAQAAGRPLLWLDPSRTRILAASSRTLSSATLAKATASGEIELQIASEDGQRTALVVNGAPVGALRDRAGAPAGTIVGLPRERPETDLDLRAGIPVWVWTTTAIGVIGLVLTFALSRQILQPVGALTAAARRMEAGDLDVRVEQRTGGADEIGNLAQAFNAMASRLSETERLRKQLVSDVAHELRSPVTNLRVTLEAIQDGLLPLDRASIDALHEETLFLQRLLLDLQDLTLADAGQLPLRTEPLDLSATVRRAVAALGQRVGEAPIHTHVANGLTVKGDPDRLEQVFRNLIENARRHTPAEGRIDIRARSTGSTISVQVADTGAGIDRAHLPHVFDRFYRADFSRSRETGGAGLGLAIVRQLVAAHGGAVTAASEGAGKGAAFTVTLPSFTTS